jgi:hypothetical protein
MTAPPSLETVLQTSRWLESFWRDRNDTSFDPFDGLETDRFAWLVSLPRIAQLAVVQVNKRSPINLRRLLGIRPTRNAYSAAHFASACALLAPLSSDQTAGELEAALFSRLDWLCENRIGAAWGYPFDVQTKTFAYAKSVPNVICTAFAVTALLDGIAYHAPIPSATGDAKATPSGEQRRRLDRWSQVVSEAVSFTLEQLLTRESGRVYFRYLRANPLLIHNANLLAARYVARAGVAFGEKSWVDVAAESIPISLRTLSAAGLPPYGEGQRQSWVDGHHTGFVAEALGDLTELLADQGLGETARKILVAYRRSLFEASGRPLLFPGRRFPIDVIAGAQGIQTFAKAGTAGDVVFGREIAGFTLSHMRSSTGNFLYRRGRLHSKSVPYARWSDAPMCLALAHLAHAMKATAAPTSGSPLTPPNTDSVSA